MELPGQSNYYSACGARIRELNAIEKELAKCEHGHRAFQRLPRNMQRRALSINPQRLPLSLKERHKREIGSKIRVSKRPSRKYRRRASNLKAEYNRRQRNQVWLESHIWHAKRFHMVKKWGYCLPKTPTNKSYRPTLRAATESCLVQDVSYECILEIEGAYSNILSSLKTMISEEEFVGLSDDHFKNGSRWFRATLYKPHRYPFEAFGDAQLICCCHINNGVNSKIWICVHPSMHEEVLTSFVNIFKLEEEQNAENDVQISPIDPVVQARLCAVSSFRRTPKYTSSCVTLTLLKDTLVKFRLTGPRSHRAVQNVLKPSDVSIHLEESDKEDSTKTPWWVSFYSNPDHARSHESQLALWNSLRPNAAPSRRIVSFIARDPRATLPTKKESVLKDEDIETTSEVTEETNVWKNHPIYSREIRDSVTFNLQSTQEINQKRSNFLLPGTSLLLDNEESRIPVLLMERPGCNLTANLGHGWDVILPSGIGAQTMVSFAMNGVAIGGQDQEGVLQAEFLIPPNSQSMPDTVSGKQNIIEEEKERRDHYFKRPPLCRVNYIKLGVRFPFGIDWSELMRNWDPSMEDLFVLRKKPILDTLAIITCPKIGKLRTRISDEKMVVDDDSIQTETRDENPIISTDKRQILKDKAVRISSSKDIKHSLIYIRLVLIGKGSLEPLAMITLPTNEDLQFYSPDGSCNFTELPHEDQNSEAREKLKIEHHKNLNNLRRKRKRAKEEVLCAEENPLKEHSSMRKALDSAVSKVLEKNKETVNSVSSYSPTINNLWLQDRTKVKFQSCSRNIIGYLTHGGFCMRMGRSGGLGYVVTEPLLKHMEETLNLPPFKDEAKGNSAESENQSIRKKHNQVLVLVRHPSSLQYRWARLVILNVW